MTSLANISMLRSRARPTACRTAASPRGCRSRSLAHFLDASISTVLALPMSAVPLAMRLSAVAFVPEATARAHLDEVLHRADRGVAGRHQHLHRHAQIVVEQRLDRMARLGLGALVGLGDIDRAGPAELLRRRLIAVLPRLIAIGVVIARDQIGRRRTSRGTDICAPDRPPRRRSRSSPGDGIQIGGCGV